MITANLFYTDVNNEKPCNKLSLFFNSSNTECRWISIPFGTYYNKTFKDVGEALQYLDSRPNVRYELITS